LTQATKQTFEDTNRPYVAVDNHVSQINPQSNRLEIGVSFRNFGNVPARELSEKFEVLINGIVQAQEVLPSTTYVLVPQVVRWLRYTLPSQEVNNAVMAGTAVVEVRVSFTYQGPTGKIHQFTDRARYQPNDSSFWISETIAN
jgi:hypothetical protein